MLMFNAGNNDLSNASLKDLRELCRVGVSPHTHAVVEIGMTGEFSGFIRYEITEPDARYDSHDPRRTAYRMVIERIPDAAIKPRANEEKTLTEFLRWSRERYPSVHEILVLWGHGDGQRVTIDLAGRALTMNSIRNALKNSEYTPKRPLTILGFDACLMSNIENAYEFKDFVTLLIGSQALEPIDGWPYDKLLAKLNTNPDPLTVTHSLIADYISSYHERLPFGICLAVVELKKLDHLALLVSDLGTYLQKNVTTLYGDIRKSRIYAQSFLHIGFVDLLDFTRNVANRSGDEHLLKLVKDMAAAHANCIRAEKLGYTVKDASGLSIWFPSFRKQFEKGRDAYTRLAFSAEHSGWLNFLDLYHARSPAE